MSEHSDEFEREVLESLHEIRGTIRSIKLVFALLIGIPALLALIAIAGIVINRGFSSDNATGSGVDLHAPLRQGATLGGRTEAGQQVSVTILSLTWAQGPVLQVRLTGLKGDKLPATPWTFVLTNNEVLALTSEGSLDRLTVRFDGSLPAGSQVRFVHFNPDESHGDLYFDVLN